MLPRAIYMFNAIPIKISWTFFTELDNNLKICMESEKTPDNWRNFEKENLSGGHHNAGLKLYYKAVIIKTVWYWHKNRHIDQWNRIENPEIGSQLFGQLIFDKAGKTIHWKKDTVSSINGAGKTGQPRA